MASLLKNTASQNITFCLVNATTGAALTSATFTSLAWVTKDNGVQAGFAGTFSTLGNGQYNYAPTQAETNCTDFGLLITVSGAIPVNLDFHTDSPTVLTTGVNVINWSGSAVASPSQSGVPITDPHYWNGTAFVSTATAGIPDINVKNIANSAVSTSTAQIGANLVNVLGVSVQTSLAQIGTNLVNIAGVSVASSTAQLGVNVVNILGVSVQTSLAQVGANVVNIAGASNAGAAGYVGLDWSKINSPSSTVSLSATTIGTATTVTNPVTVTSNIKANTGSQYLSFTMTDSTAHAPLAGLTVASSVSINGAAFVATANSVTAISNGDYTLTLNAADTNGKTLLFRFTATGADDLNIMVITQP